MAPFGIARCSMFFRSASLRIRLPVSFSITIAPGLVLPWTYPKRVVFQTRYDGPILAPPPHVSF